MLAANYQNRSGECNKVSNFIRTVQTSPESRPHFQRNGRGAELELAGIRKKTFSPEICFYGYTGRGENRNTRERDKAINNCNTREQDKAVNNRNTREQHKVVNNRNTRQSCK